MRRAAPFVLLAALGCAQSRASTAPQAAPPPPPIPASLADQGQALFASEVLPGAGGRSCKSCHEQERPLEGYQLARQVQNLSKTIAACLRDRVRPSPDTDADDVVRALEAYLRQRYVSEGAGPRENDEATQHLGEAMKLFVDGLYDEALAEVQTAHRQVQTDRFHVRALLLEGSIYVFRLSTDRARRAFREALALDPEVKIDGSLFSPKVQAVLEDVRQEVSRERAPSELH